MLTGKSCHLVNLSDQTIAEYRQIALNMLMANHINLAFAQHKSVLVLTNDIEGTIARLRQAFPGHLLEVCNNGVRIFKNAKTAQKDQ